MKKRERKFERLEEMKQRFRKLSSDRIRDYLNSGYVGQEGQIAYREVLEERGECAGSCPNSTVPADAAKRRG